MGTLKETKIVNLYKESYDIYIGRAGKGKDGYFGNPIKLKPTQKPGDTLAEYKEYFINRISTDPEFKKKSVRVKG